MLINDFLVMVALLAMFAVVTIVFRTLKMHMF